MRFHLIDRIDHWAPYRSVVARKAVSVTDCPPGRDGAREFPVSLTVECICQAGTWLLVLSSGFASRAALLSIGKLDVVSAGRPGDSLRIDVEIESVNGSAAMVSGAVTTQDGRLVLTAADILCSIVPADELAAPEATRRMAIQLTETALVDREPPR